MGFNSAEIAIADIVSRVTDPTDQREIKLILEAADEEQNRETSESEVRDYLARKPMALLDVSKPALQQVLDALGAVTPPAEISARGRMFLQVRSALTGITLQLDDLQRKGDSSPTTEEALQIAKLEAELARNVSAASELAKDPQFATIVGYANAAIIRIASFRKYDIFGDDTFATPPRLTPSPEATIVCTRLELAAVRAVVDRISYPKFMSPQGAPPQLTQLVDDLHRIRSNLERLGAPNDPTAVAALHGDFLAALRLAASTIYTVRITSSRTVAKKIGDLDLPAPL